MANLAPYKIVKRGMKYAVVNNANETKATFKTHAEAVDYMQALYANVKGAARKAAKTPWTGKAKPLPMKSKAAQEAGTNVVVLENGVPPLQTNFDPADETPAPFLVDGPESTILTAPAAVLGAAQQAEWEHAASPNPHYMYVAGRFVEADNPNGNGAMWTSDALEMAQATVTNGPLNWLHDERHIIGTLTDSRLVKREAAEAGVGTHIQATAVVWKFIWPTESKIIETASMDRSLWYSMECVTDTVTCVDTPGRPGCGETFDYRDILGQKSNICSHLRERSSVRRFNEPTFLGGAIIVPPVKPGWANADVQVMRQAAALAEENGLGGLLSKEAAEAMVAQVIQYAAHTR